MKLRFLTHEPAVCRLIASRLTEDDVECCIDSDAMGVYDDLLNGSVDYDLLVCDFKALQMSIFNVYDFLQERSVILPIVFYNDPFPSREDRVAYWLMQNERLYDGESLRSLIPVLEKLNQIIESDDVHPYVSLLQPPLPTPGSEAEAAGGHRALDLRLFRKRNRLQPGLFKLFKIFYENQQQELSLKELSKRMWGTSSKGNTVYSYISRLRKCIKNDYLVRIDIERTAPGCYEMTVY